MPMIIDIALDTRTSLLSSDHRVGHLLNANNRKYPLGCRKGLPGPNLSRLLQGTKAKPVPYLCCGIVDHLLGSQVTLVAYQELVHAFVGISVDFVEPLLDIVKTVLVCHVIDNL